MPSTKFVDAAIPESEAVIIQVRLVTSPNSWTYYGRCQENFSDGYLEVVKSRPHIIDARVESSN